MLFDRGPVQLYRAAVFEAAGHRAETERSLRLAVDLFVAKGDLPDAARARHRLAQLA